MMTEQSFTEWTRRIEQLQRWSRALNACRKASLNPDLIETLLRECWYALRWRDSGDLSRRERERDSALLRSIPNIVRDAKHVRDFLAKESDRLAFLPSGHRARAALDDLLADLAHPKIPGVRAGPMIWRFKHGCMLFDAPLDTRRRLPDFTTVLAFTLEVQCRAATGGHLLQEGHTLRSLSSGKPLSPIVAAFVSAATERTVAAAQVRTLLRPFQVLGVGWVAFDAN